MLFNSYEFIFVYLPVVFFIFFFLAKHCGKTVAAAWIVIASLGFYGWWDWRYVPLLLASICFNYWIGVCIAHTESRKGWLVFGVSTNIALLGYFKYTSFFLTTLNDLSGAAVFEIPQIVLPLGISFFTFTQTAYLLDVYGGGGHVLVIRTGSPFCFIANL